MAKERFTLIAANPQDDRAAFARNVREGLTSCPKRLACRYFYDQRGSELFEAICELPEYYVTRAEREILQARAEEIASRFRAPVTLVELGSGNASKTRLLIEAFLRRQQSLRYVPIDICRETLEASSRRLLEDYPALEVMAVAAEYHDGLRHLCAADGQAKLILWLGSNLGNFHREEAAGFLQQVRQTMAAGDRLLAGIDLRKDRDVLERAYDDSQGVTAAFNLNLLARINHELGGHFDMEAFQHRAGYDAEVGRVEMYVVSKRAQRVRIDGLGLEVGLEADEAIHTENSYKFSPAEIESLASAAGLAVEYQWFDSEHRFSVNLLTLTP